MAEWGQAALLSVSNVKSPRFALQAFNSSSGLVMKGSASILSGLQVYQAKEWVLRSWRDVFVDLVQGQLQFLFLSLLAGKSC